MKVKLFNIVFLFLSIVSFSQKNNNENTRPKVGVVLSGGGAKGYAHIGALKKIEEAGVKIDYIGGTSMGAIVGGLYAAGYSPDQLEDIIKKLDLTSIIINEKTRTNLPYFDKENSEKYIVDLPFNNFKLTLPQAISTGQGPLDLLTYLLRNVHNVKDFNNLEIPFLCIATDIETGQEKIFNQGFLPKVILASAAYPSMIRPVEIDNHLYIDGGVLNNFPVQEVKDMGADIIIGVDLQDPLKNKDELKSATDILLQIVKFDMEKKSEEQRQLANVLILPNTDGYNVASFNEVTPIIKRGIEAAEIKMDDLRAIAALQHNPTLRKTNLDSEYILIRNIDIEGNNSYNKNYIEGALKIKTPQLVSYKEIQDGINRLYSSGNFNKVEYRLNKNSDNEYSLQLSLNDNPVKQKIRFGLHYDDYFKTSLLLNFTAKKLLFKNSTFSTDFIVGDNLRYNLNYFIDNGYLPSIGFRSKFNKLKKDISLINISDNKNEINYYFNDLVNQIYLQSTLMEKYAIGLGLEHQYLEIYTNNYVGNDFPYTTNSKGYIFKGYAYLAGDSRNNRNFPSRGALYNASFKYSFNSNLPNFSNNQELKVELEKNFFINNFLSYRFTANFGTFFNSNTPDVQKFIVGGYINQHFLNYSRFYGLPFGTLVANNNLSIGSEIQFKILKNHYATAFINVANVEDRLEDILLLKYNYTGFGAKYGYDSALGPINLYWAYSPQTKKGLFNISLGYWF